MTPIALALHAAVTGAMTGLAWFVALVHYPLMAAVGRDEFPLYERLHQQRTTWLVAPLMIAEAALSVWLAVFPPPGVPAWQAATGALLVAAIWLSTFSVQVPLHTKLAAGFDASLHRRLVSSHWWRTAAWTLRSLLAFAWLVSH